jgi:hypothetical protein
MAGVREDRGLGGAVQWTRICVGEMTGRARAGLPSTKTDDMTCMLQGEGRRAVDVDINA